MKFHEGCGRSRIIVLMANSCKNKTKTNFSPTARYYKFRNIELKLGLFKNFSNLVQVVLLSKFLVQICKDQSVQGTRLSQTRPAMLTTTITTTTITTTIQISSSRSSCAARELKNYVCFQFCDTWETCEVKLLKKLDVISIYVNQNFKYTFD